MCSWPHDPDCPGYDPGPGDPLDPEYLRQRIREDPGDWRRWYRLGDRLLDLCREENRALEALDHASCLNPRNGLIRKLMTTALLRLRASPSSVLAVAEHAARLRPEDPDCWQVVGGAELRLYRLDRALEAWQRVAALAPGAEIWWQIGGCLHAMGRGREALIALEEAVRLKPNHLPALRRLYLVARDLGETDTARRHLEALFGFNPVRARELMEEYSERPGTPAWVRAG